MKTIIGVMGAGETASDRDVILAEELGELIAREGWVVLGGGRPAGVMQAAVRGAKRVEGSLTIGILPTQSGAAADELDIAIFTGMGEARNLVNVLSSHVIITCGALNAGTTSEAAFAVKAEKPLILLAPGPEAAAFFRTLTPQLVVVNTPHEAIDAAKIRSVTGS